MTRTARRPTMAGGRIRRHHLSLVLEALVRDGPQSRAELARHTGLTKATASALVTELLERELVEEHDTPRAGRIGRPAVDVAAAGWSVGGLGLEINVDYVSACIVDLSGTIRIRHRRSGDNANARPQTVLKRLYAVGRPALEDADAAGIRVPGGTLAVPGLVDPSSGALLVTPHLDSLKVALDQPAGRIDVGVDNEATLGALAELRYGAARDLSSFVYVSAGTGVGGGIVIDGRVVHGSNGFAGELGHVVVDPNGPECACGARGCLDVFVGGGNAATAPPEALARALATALRSVVHIMDPQAVILGGSLARSTEVIERLATLLRDETLGGRWRPCEVRGSLLGVDAAMVGAATTVLDAVVADPTLVSRRAEAQSA